MPFALREFRSLIAIFLHFVAKTFSLRKQEIYLTSFLCFRPFVLIWKITKPDNVHLKMCYHHSPKLFRILLFYDIIHPQIEAIPNLESQKKPFIIDLSWKSKIKSSLTILPNWRLCNKIITVSQILEVRTPQHIDTKTIDFCSITAIIHSVNTLPKMIDCLSKYKINLTI